MQPRRFLLTITLLSAALACAAPGDEATSGSAAAGPSESSQHPGSDSRAVEIAHSVIDRMGGQAAWDHTRFVSWKFFARRQHYWDRLTGDVRIESPTNEGDLYVILMNINDLQGRAWKNGEPIEDPDELKEALAGGHEMWVNDSYWMFMPYKLLDPGVNLAYEGERAMEDGRLADVLGLTFDAGVGYTPENRYEVFVARDSGLVEQWAFYAAAGNPEPNFTLPWADWRQFGNIMLATGHGRNMNWEIKVYDELPPAVFQDPAQVQL